LELVRCRLAHGEENEVLRNLLTDTGRKISELDDLKAAFDTLVAPFNSTLRALKQEKLQTLSQGMLAEADEPCAPSFIRSTEKRPRLRAKSKSCAKTSSCCTPGWS
jgi:hypothetical protein